MDTHNCKTPFDQIEKSLYTNEAKNAIFSPVQLILNAGKDPKGHFTSKFLTQVEKAFKEHILYLSEVSMKADDDEIKKELGELHFLKKSDENSLLEYLEQNITKFYLLIDEDSEKLKGDALWATLFVWMDTEYTCPIFANQSLNIFTLFSLSVLKAEYLYDDYLSNKRIDPLRQHIRNNYKMHKDKIVLMFIARSDANYYLRNIENLCDLYFKFNRKIDNVIDYKNNATLHLMKVEEAADEMSKYQMGIGKLTYEPDDLAILLEISSIYPYLFLYILEMTYIDHNFIIGKKELETLLTLRTIIKQVYSFFDNDSKLPLNLIDKNIRTNFLHVLQLVDFKNDFLIYKTINSDKSNLLDDYTFIGGHNTINFRVDELYSKKDCDTFTKRDTLDVNMLLNKYCDTASNDLLKEARVYNQLLKKEKVYLDNEPTLRGYERHFCKVIYHKEAEKIAKHFEQIPLAYKAQKEDIPIDYKDISSYNRKIAQHAKVQFVKYGKYIKRLEGLKNASLDAKFEYLRELNMLLKTDIEVYSCSFIIKHTDFVLNALNTLCDKNNYNSFGFTLRMEIETLLHISSRLLKSIENNTYCMNFASLYQDCFFNFTWKDTSDNRFLSITRQEYHTKDIIEKEGDYVEVVQPNVIENLKADLFTSKLNKETIFIASTWLRPVGKEELKNKFENFKFLKNNYIARFYSLYFSHYENKNKLQEKKFDELFKEFNEKAEETKRNMVQTLGIFAAFLALATTSIGALGASKNPIDYLKVIFSITFCLGIFVLMLNHVFPQKEIVTEDTRTEDGKEKAKKKWNIWFNKVTILYWVLFIVLIMIFIL